MKIVVLDGYTLNPGDLSWEPLLELGEVVIYDRTSREDLFLRASEADILITNKTPLKRELIEQLPKLKYIGVLATGYNIVDVEAAREYNITVTNVPTYGTKAVAQFVFAHLLEICHHVGEHSKSVREGKWNRQEDFCYWDKPLIELDGKVMGIIGTGRIGMETAKIAKSFGMTVVAYRRENGRRHEPIESHEDEAEALFNYLPPNEFFAVSDVISLHCPLTEENRGMLNASAFNMMKTGVIIINTARGPLIDEIALAAALKNGKVYAAGLDVLSKEPPIEPSPLYAFEQCNITPHIAWAPLASRNRLLGIAIDNLKAFMAGRVKNTV